MNDEEDTTQTPSTSSTLLKDVSMDTESVRMEEFARIYEPVLRRYVARAQAGFRTISECEQEDLVQEAFMTVQGLLPGFRYDRKKGKFRAYLQRIVFNQVRTLRRQLARRPESAEEAVLEEGTSVVELDPETKHNQALALRIWSHALALVLSGVQIAPNTKAVYRRLVIEGNPVESVAREFRLKPNAIYQIKNRIHRAVRKELLRVAQKEDTLEEILEKLLSRSTTLSDSQ